MKVLTHIACVIGGTTIGVIFTCLFVASGREDRRNEK